MQIERVEIFLVRHGEVDFPPGIFYGQRDVLLSSVGKRQSVACGKRLSKMGIDAIVSSDLSRCVYLAELLSKLTGIEPVFDKRIREIDFGKWQGLSWEEIEDEYPGQLAKRMANLATYRPPGGESLGDLLDRSFPLLQECFEGMFGKRVVVVCHGGVNRVLLCSLLGMDLQRLFSIEQDYTCLNVIHFYGDGQIVVRSVNCTCHLERL